MKAIIAAVLLTVSGAVYAACSTSTYIYNGKMVVCTTCCTGYNNCTTTCI